MKRIMFILASFALFLGCNKTILDAITNTCDELVSSDPGGFTTESYLSYRYFYPSFDPGDSSRFVCIRMNTATSATQLILFNTSTHDTTVLANCSMDVAPRYGKRNWILYSDGDTIRRINDDGTKIFAAFTDSYVHSDPDWDRAGDLIISHYTDGAEEGTIFTDLDGITHGKSSDIDYKNGSFYPCKSRCAYSYVDGNDIVIAWFDTTLASPTTFHTFTKLSDESIINSMVWFKNQQDLLWSNGTSVGISNINSGNTRIFKDNCNAKTYLHPSISGGGDKFLFETQVATKVSETELLIENRIVMMNLDGTGEYDVLF